MLGIYLFAAILGGGLLVFSLMGGDHGADDASGMDAGHDFDHDVGHDAGHDVGHDAELGAGELLLGLFRPRNLIFFLAAFGVTGTLLSLLTSVSSAGGVIPAVGMGLGAMVLSHGLFTWLKRSGTVAEAVSESELEGSLARVTLPVAPGERGRIACTVGDREVYIVARLAAGYDQTMAQGREVVVLSVADGVAEVMPFDARELPPGDKD